MPHRLPTVRPAKKNGPRNMLPSGRHSGRQPVQNGIRSRADLYVRTRENFCSSKITCC